MSAPAVSKGWDDQAGGGCRGNRAPDLRWVGLPVGHKGPERFDGGILGASLDGERWTNSFHARSDDSRNRAPCDEVKCSCRSSGDHFSKRYRAWQFIPCRSPFAISGSWLRSPHAITRPTGLRPLRHPLALATPEWGDMMGHRIFQAVANSEELPGANDSFRGSDFRLDQLTAHPEHRIRKRETRLELATTYLEGRRSTN
jgi:hypothetical protein